MSAYRTIHVSGHEFGLIIAGLKRMRSKIAHDIRRGNERGFVPEPGQEDVNVLKRDTLAKLMARLEIE